MADTERIARIRAYLEQHRNTYDREALRRQLLADGHDPEAIDAAMAQVYGLHVGPQSAPTLQGESSFNTTPFALMIISTVALNFILFMCGPLFIAADAIATSTGTQFVVALALSVLTPLLLEGGAAVALRRRNPAVSRGLMWGVIATVVAVPLAFLLMQACFLLLGG